MRMPNFFMVFFLASSASLAVMPAAASDYTLEIFGNANLDDIIDEDDIEYVKGVIEGNNDATELADANYDGQIDEEDIIQIELIIRGEEEKLTFIAPTEVLQPAPPEIITIEKPVERIVVLMAPSAEVLRSLDAEDKIVGVGTHIKDEDVLFPELSKLPVIGQWMGPGLDYEAILSLDPDLFLAFVKGPTYVDEDKLPGVTIIGMNLRSPENFTERVRLLGYIIDKEEEAEEYINWHEGWTDVIRSRTEALSEDEKPNVLHWSFFQAGGDYRTIHETSRIHQMGNIAGGRDLAEGLPGTWPTVDAEWVITQNPEIIVAQAYSDYISSGYGSDASDEMAAAREDIINRPELADVTAVKTGDVYMMAFVDIATGGSGCLIGTAYMAKWFHPDLFEDLDPQSIHQEYLTRFQGLDYDLDQHGVFIYPPLT
jgi:iron complex transport system substrate-binding protein